MILVAVLITIFGVIPIENKCQNFSKVIDSPVIEV
jgi:hypothetical protein